MIDGSRISGPSRRAALADERGSLTIFSLFIIVIMLIVGGMAVDFMRQEATRARLQSTLDRAILAAADMDQKLDPTSVVQDYFAKSGVAGVQVAVQVADGDSSRKVQAQTQATLDSFFLNFVGIDTLVAPAAGTAEESISNVEISLVLDVSGSMSEISASGKTKISELKVAAKDFIDTIFAQTAPDRTTLSIVPYSTQVAIGPDLMKQYNVTTEHDSSYCVDFDKADYASAAVSTATLLQRTGHFDPMSGSGTRKAGSFVCRTDTAMRVLPLSGDPAALKAKISALFADGYTSIEMGVKWGAALVDPSARPAVDGLIADGVTDARFAGRPLDYDRSKTLKVIVVMTDGINTNQWFLDDRYRDGLSNVWIDPVSQRLSIEGPEVGDRDGDGKAGETYFIKGTGKSDPDKWDNTPFGGLAAVRLTWPQLWASVAVNYNAAQHQTMTGKSTDYNLWSAGMTKSGTYFPGAYALIGGSAKDSRTDAICTAAKDAGIRIYSIGFEVTNASAVVLSNCASTPAHFFRVDGLSIYDAFQQIANDIGKLRLTQ